MARDFGMEELLREHLAEVPGLAEKPMFGGLAWLLRGHLLCGARKKGALFRLGKGNDIQALEIKGVTPMMVGTRRMHGWVDVPAEVVGDDAVLKNLLDGALEFVRTLPDKD